MSVKLISETASDKLSSRLKTAKKLRLKRIQQEITAGSYHVDSLELARTIIMGR